MKRSSLRRHTPLRKSKPDPGWFAAREAALERDNHWPTCHKFDLHPDQPCWGGLEIHHRLRRSQGGTHDLDNLVTLCSLGHRLVHENPARSYEMGLLIRSGFAS